ncbi:MAG: hypothetical protein P8X98_11230 [Woeseiaceae bacterium]
MDRKRDYAETADDFWSDTLVSELQRRLAVILALGVFVCSAYLLATASAWLLVEPLRLSGLPLGTLIAWIGIVSLPMASFLGFHRFLNRETRPARISRSLMICLLLLGAAWGFVAYGLAGNWAFNFSNQTDSFRGSAAAGEIFWAYSKSIVSVTLLVSAVLFALTLFKRGDW